MAGTRYNRDPLGALAGSVLSIRVLPRFAPDPVATPGGISQEPPRRDRVRYAVATLRAALTKRPDLICHLYMVPLCVLIARLTRGKLIIQMHGIEAWRGRRNYRAAVEAADLVLCVSRYTRGRVLGWAGITPEKVVVFPNTVSSVFKGGRIGPAGGVRWLPFDGCEDRNPVLLAESKRGDWIA